jgi:hypothetical protein
MVFIQTTIEGVGFFTHNAVSQKIVDICRELRPQTARVLKQRSLRPCEVLQCPTQMAAGQKMKAVKEARKGNRPDWLKPSQWAWNPLNPKANKKAA